LGLQLTPVSVARIRKAFAIDLTKGKIYPKGVLNW